MVVCGMFIYNYIFLPYVQMSENRLKILWIQFDVVAVKEIPRWIQKIWKWSSNEESGCGSVANGRKPVDPHATNVVYRERLLAFYSEHAMLLEVIQVVMCGNSNQSWYDNTVPCIYP